MKVDVALLLFVLALGAFLVPLLAAKLRVPDAVGQILFGVLAGGLGLARIVDVSGGAAGSALGLLAELGFVLLMFGAGLEIDFDALERGGTGSLGRGFAVSLGLVVAAAVLSWAAGLPAFYVVVISATSIGLAAAVLRETGLSKRPVGQAVLLIGGLGEILTLVSMTVFHVMHRVGPSLRMAVEIGRIFVLFGFAALVLRFLRAWTWWHPEVFARAFARHDPSEIGVRAAIAACLGFVLVAVMLALDPVLGAFIAGAVSRAVFRGAGELERKMSALSAGFFVPVFFIWVGLSFDLGQLSWRGMGDAAMLGGLVLAVRLVPCAALVAARDLGLRDAAGVALLLASPLTLLVATAKLGEQIGVLGGAEASNIVLLAVLLSIVAPVAFRQILAPAARGPRRQNGGA